MRGEPQKSERKSSHMGFYGKTLQLSLAKRLSALLRRNSPEGHYLHWLNTMKPINLGAVVVKWSGHRPGNRKVPGSMPGIDPWLLLLCFLGQETYPSPSHPAVKLGHVV